MKKGIVFQGRRGTSQGNAVSLFPFLAVLLCTMGALIMLLVVIAQSIRQPAPETASVETPPAKTPSTELPPMLIEDVPAETGETLPPMDTTEDAEEAPEDEPRLTVEEAGELLRTLRMREEDAEWFATELQASSKKVEENLSEERAILAALEKQVETRREEIERTLKVLEETRRMDMEKGLQKQEVLDGLRTKTEELAVIEAEVRKLREASENRPKSYAVVPYRGSGGTLRRPIYIECREDKAILQPEGIELNPLDFLAHDQVDNPLDSALRAARNYLAETGQLAPGEEPYPLFIVRPSGIETFGEARSSLGTWVNDFGYELVEEDVQVEYPSRNSDMGRQMGAQVAGSRERLRGLILMRAEERLARPAPQFRMGYDGRPVPLNDPGMGRPGGERPYGGRDSRVYAQTPYARTPRSQDKMPDDEPLQHYLSRRTAQYVAEELLTDRGERKRQERELAVLEGQAASNPQVDALPRAWDFGYGAIGGNGNARDGSGSPGDGLGGTNGTPGGSVTAMPNVLPGGYSGGTSRGTVFGIPRSARGQGQEQSGGIPVDGLEGSIDLRTEFPPDSDATVEQLFGRGPDGENLGTLRVPNVPPTIANPTPSLDNRAKSDTDGTEPYYGTSSPYASSGKMPQPCDAQSTACDAAQGAGSGTGSATSPLTASVNPAPGPGAPPGMSSSMMELGAGGPAMMLQPPSMTVMSNMQPGWGIPDAARNTTAVSRTVRVKCEGNALTIVAQPGLRRAVRIDISSTGREAGTRLVEALWKYMETWGTAGERMYWQPLLKVEVVPGGEVRYEELCRLLHDSGIRVEKQ